MKRTKFGKWIFVWIISLCLLGVGGVFAFTSNGLNLLGATTAYIKQPLGLKNTILQGFKTFYESLLTVNRLIYFIVAVCILALVVLVIVIQIIVYSKKKTKKMIWWIIFTALVGVLLAWMYGFGVYVLQGYGSGRVALKALLPWLAFQNRDPQVSIWVSVLIYVTLLGILLLLVSSLVILIKTFVYSRRYNKYVTSYKEQQETPESLSYEGSFAGVPTGSNTNNINTVGNSSPLIVQYINSYGTDNNLVRPISNEQAQVVPQTQVQPQVASQQAPYQPYGYPVYPYPPFYGPVEKPLTKADLKEIFEEFKKDEPQEVKVTYQNSEGEELEYIDANELKDLIKGEIEDFLGAELAQPQKVDEQVKEPATEETKVEVNETIGYKEEAPVLEKQVVTLTVNTLEKKVELTTPVVVALPRDIKDEIIVKEEVEENDLTEDEVRDLVSSELKDALKDFIKPRVIRKVVTKEVPVEVIKEVPVEVIKEVKVPVKKEEPKVEEVKVEKPLILEEKPAKVEQKVQKQFVKRGQENVIEKGEIVRLNFLERIAEGDQILKDNYNAVKGLLMSYGLKNRLSNTGDTFRLHKVTYAKITCNGDSLKLYLALNPKDFQSTALPVQDVSNKDAYKDIPLAFKVRSELSLRRANELIATCMRNANLELIPNFEAIDYTKEITTELDNAKKVEEAVANSKAKSK